MATCVKSVLTKLNDLGFFSNKQKNGMFQHFYFFVTAFVLQVQTTFIPPWETVFLSQFDVCTL